MKELLIWGLTSMTFGILEAILFHNVKGINKGFKDRYGFDIHALFVVIRLAVLIPLAISVEETFIFVLVAVFIFPFIHDGFYYQFRHWLNNKSYPKGFLDYTNTSSAKISLSLAWRIIFFIFGLGMVFVLI